jgi:glycosyltransferase involved in cell wall biosynthesis
VATNIHAFRWITALAERGLDILVITQQPPEPGEYPPSVRFEVLPFRGRLAYALNALALRSILRRSGADLLHVHYAGGYGATIWLSGIRRCLVSVWGGDVYDVPERSWLHRFVVSRALDGAGRITSTSHVMKAQVERLGISTRIDVVPFGVDTNVFQPRAEAQGDRFVIGTVKTLARKYGVDTLIRGFALALEDPGFVALQPELRIAGGGPGRKEYERLVRELGIAGRVKFLGQVPHELVPSLLAGFDVYAAVSRDDSESFGVAIIEASACGLPVVVSDAGGLPEVVEDEHTGLIIPRDDAIALSTVLVRLARDRGLRERLGRAGVQRVRRLYEWSDCVDSMLEVYRQMQHEPNVQSDSVLSRLFGTREERCRKRFAG